MQHWRCDSFTSFLSSSGFMSEPDSRFTVKQIFWFFRKNSSRFLGLIRISYQFLDHAYPLLGGVKRYSMEDEIKLGMYVTYILLYH